MTANPAAAVPEGLDILLGELLDAGFPVPSLDDLKDHPEQLEWLRAKLEHRARFGGRPPWCRGGPWGRREEEPAAGGEEGGAGKGAHRGPPHGPHGHHHHPHHGPGHHHHHHGPPHHGPRCGPPFGPPPPGMGFPFCFPGAGFPFPPPDGDPKSDLSEGESPEHPFAAWKRHMKAHKRGRGGCGFGGPGFGGPGFGRFGHGRGGWGNGLRLDVYETDTAWIVTANLPGWDKTDVKVELQDNKLVLTGERTAPEPEGQALRQERHVKTAFNQTFELPTNNFEAQAMEARLEKGELKVTIPKRTVEAPKTYTVDVRSPSDDEKMAVDDEAGPSTSRPRRSDEGWEDVRGEGAAGKDVAAKMKDLAMGGQ